MYWRAIFYWRFIVMLSTLSCPKSSPVLRKNSAGNVSPLSLKLSFIFTRKRERWEGRFPSSRGRGRSWPRNFRPGFCREHFRYRSPISLSGASGLHPFSLPLLRSSLPRIPGREIIPREHPQRGFPKTDSLYGDRRRVLRSVRFRWDDDTRRHDNSAIGYASFP